MKFKITIKLQAKHVKLTIIFTGNREERTDQSGLKVYFYPLEQRWCPRGRPWPRGQILKSLASKVKSLALRPQVLENWPVLGSRTAVFFELLKLCEAAEKLFGKRFFVEIA